MNNIGLQKQEKKNYGINKVLDVKPLVLLFTRSMPIV